jgi:peptide/nickel transport system ATP-binding protein
MNALNPVKRVGDQITEPILLHEKVDMEVAVKRVKELFELVGINPNRIREYPHEFSGGMRQRVMIAMALACRPKLVICDEPTTALDVMIQAQILQLLKNLQTELELAMIIISHDLSVLAETCEFLSIMYAGKIVERSSAVEVFTNPQHPYTKGLIAAFPNIKGDRKMPASIAGNPPNLIHAPPGCRFADRCYMAQDLCKKDEPPLVEVLPGHYAACHFVKPKGVK